MVLDIGVLVDWPSVKCGQAFTDGLQQALPSLAEHGCSYREAGGFMRRLTEDDGTWMGHIMEHVALEIQNIAGSSVSFGRTRTTGEPGMYNMVYAYKQRDAGIEAGHLALRLLMHLLPEHLQQQIDTRSIPISISNRNWKLLYGAHNDANLDPARSHWWMPRSNATSPGYA